MKIQKFSFTKMLMAAVFFIATDPAQAASPVFNEFICTLQNYKSNVTLYENKTAGVKWSTAKKSGTYKTKWSKDGDRIYLGEMSDLSITRGKIFLYDPDHFGQNGLRCRMK